jgi:hypothetical protein
MAEVEVEVETKEVRGLVASAEAVLVEGQEHLRHKVLFLVQLRERTVLAAEEVGKDTKVVVLQRVGPVALSYFFHPDCRHHNRSTLFGLDFARSFQRTLMDAHCGWTRMTRRR